MTTSSSQECRLVIGLALSALMALLSPGRADAQEPDPAEPSVNYYRTEYLGTVDGRIHLRGRFELTASAKGTYGVFFQLRTPSKEILRFEGHPDGRIWKVDDVALPAGQPAAKWVSDVSIPVSDLTGITNLPRGQRSGVWGQCDIWDRARQKYIGFGGGEGPTFLLTIDAEGKVVSVDPPDPPREGPIRMPEQRLLTRHLKLREGVKVYREVNTPIGDRTFFDEAGRRRYAGELGLFEPVDTEAKARELVELRLANRWVIRTAEQYRALRDFFKEKGGMTVVSSGDPPSHGFTVEAAPGGAFAARVLYYFPRQGGVVYHEEMMVRPDGRVEGRSVRLVTNGWYEGWPSQPAMPSDWQENCDKSVRAVLGDLEVIPDRVEPSPDAPPPPRLPTSLQPKEIYQRALKAVAWVITPEFTGTAWLVDRDNRLLVTNYHVAEDLAEVELVFPAYREGALVVEKSWYRDSAPRYRARVVDVSPADDLAILQVDRLPADAQALPLAGANPSPGDAVHSVGNPGPSDALWVYTGGAVRSVHTKKWLAGDEKQVFRLHTEVIETQSPTNHGDSGGPLLNGRGEAVGVTQGGKDITRASLVSWFISAGRVSAFLGQSRRQLDPKTAEDLNFRGVRRVSRSLYDDAIADFSAAIALEPENAQFHSNRAVAYRGKGDYTTALADLEQALKLDPNLAHGWFWRGRVYYRQRAYREAVTAYTRAIQLVPDDAESYYHRAEALALNRQYEEAIRDYGEALRLDPDHGLAHWGRGEASANLGRHVDAIREYNWAQQLGVHDSRLFNLRGEAFFSLKEYDDALKNFVEADRLAPKNATYLTNIGKVLVVGKDQLEIGIKACTVAIEIAPEYAPAYFYRGLAREMLWQIDAAQPDYEKACELRPSYKETLPLYEVANPLVLNKTGEMLNVKILYEAKTSTGSWQWYPSLYFEQAKSYSILPAKEGKVIDGDSWVQARRMRIWAVGEQTGREWTKYRNQDFWLAEKPYRATLGTAVRIFRFE